MAVGGQGFGQAPLSHNHEGDAIGQGPLLVGAFGVECATTLKEVAARRQNFHIGLLVKQVQ